MNNSAPLPKDGVGVIRAIIVDDEAPGRSNLRWALAEYQVWQVVAECATVADARRRLRNSALVDVVFLDIQMPGESGIVLARELAVAAAPPIIIFVTAYQHYAVQAFEFHALDYLLKPFDDLRLGQALKRAEALFALRQRGDYYGQALLGYLNEVDTGDDPARLRYAERLAIRSVGHIESVAVDELLWALSSGNYIELHLPSRSVLHRVTMTNLTNRLDPAVFLRVHRRAIVRKDQCTALRVTGDGTYEVHLRCGDRVPVSERHLKAVRELFNH